MDFKARRLRGLAIEHDTAAVSDVDPMVNLSFGHCDAFTPNLAT